MLFRVWPFRGVVTAKDSLARHSLRVQAQTHLQISTLFSGNFCAFSIQIRLTISVDLLVFSLLFSFTFGCCESYYKEGAAMEISHAGASFSSSIGDSTEFEAELSLSDKLKIFKPSNFDPEGYVTSKCRNMSEKVNFPTFILNSIWSVLPWIFILTLLKPDVQKRECFGPVLIRFICFRRNKELL